MAEEFVTRTELMKLEKQMTDGFGSVEKRLDKILHSMEVNQHTDLERYDARYLIKSEDVPNSIERLANPRVRQAAHSIVGEYLDTPDGTVKINCMIDRYFVMKRDATSKWIQFLKLIIGLVVALTVGYGGMTIYKDNLATQQEIVKTIQQMNIGD